MTTTEFGVRLADGSITAGRPGVEFGAQFAHRWAYMTRKDGTRVRPGAVVVSRTVTDWAEAVSQDPTPLAQSR